MLYAIKNRRRLTASAKSLILVVGLVSAGLSRAVAVEAALNVGPTRQVVLAKPGSVYRGFYDVTNVGGEPLLVNVEPENWAGGIRGDRAKVDWLTVKPNQLTITAGEQVRVRYTVWVPEDATGELRTQVFFTTTDTGGGGSQLKSRLGTIIYVTVVGTEQLDAAIRSMTFGYESTTEGVEKPDNLTVNLGIQNMSNVHIIPQGRVEVLNEEGNLAANIDVIGGWGLLPEEMDTYRAVGQGVYLKPGRYTLRAKILFGNDLNTPKEVVRDYPIIVSEDDKITELVPDALGSTQEGAVHEQERTPE